MVKNMSTIVLIIMKSVTVATYSMDLNKEQNHWVILSSKTLNYECEPGVSQEVYRALDVRFLNSLDNRKTQSTLSCVHTLPCVRGSSLQLQILENPS